MIVLNVDMCDIQVSVIIVNYNTKQLLSDCLKSINEKTVDIEYEVIVVDNDSHDGSQEMLKRDFRWVRLIESKENLGFGKANNLGMRNARGKYFLLLNSDTILVNNALKEFYDYSECHPGFGALGSILLDKDLKPCHSYGRFPSPLGSLKDVIAKYIRCLKDKSKFHPKQVLKPLAVDYVTGADLWVSKYVYETIGGFDPEFFMYFEESDWELRMSEAGLQRLIIPGPRIIHLEGGSDKSLSTRWSTTRVTNYMRSKRIYERKNFNRYVYPIYVLFDYVLRIPTKIFK